MPDFNQQYFDAQKAMFDAWQKHMASSFGGKGAGGQEGAAAFSPDFYQKLLEAPNDFWKKAGDSYKSYHAVYELWKTLSDNKKPLDKQASQEIYNLWLKQNFALIRSNLMTNLPEYMQGITEKIFESIEASSAAMADAAKSWSINDDVLKKAFQDVLTNGPRGFIGFLEAWQQNFDSTFGTFIKAPTFGKDMDFWNRQKSSFDRFVKFNVAAAKFYASLFEIAQNATKKVLEDYAVMQTEGKQPKTFEEFYKYWSKTVTAAYDKVLLSDNLSSLSGDMVDAMSRFKLEYEKLCSFYLNSIPVPKLEDLDDLYLTVSELKKELRALKKEISANEKRKA